MNQGSHAEAGGWEEGATSLSACGAFLSAAGVQCRQWQILLDSEGPGVTSFNPSFDMRKSSLDTEQLPSHLDISLAEMVNLLWGHCWRVKHPLRPIQSQLFKGPRNRILMTSYERRWKHPIGHRWRRPVADLNMVLHGISRYN